MERGTIKILSVVDLNNQIYGKPEGKSTKNENMHYCSCEITQTQT